MGTRWRVCLLTKVGEGWRGGVGEDGLSLGADWEMGFMHTRPQCTGWAVFSVAKSGLQPVSVQLEREVRMVFKVLND